MSNLNRRVDRLEAADLERRIAERWMVKWSGDMSEMRDLAGASVDPWLMDAHIQAGGIVDVDWSDVDIAQVESDDAGERAGFVYEVLNAAPIVRFYKRAP